MGSVTQIMRLVSSRAKLKGNHACFDGVLG